MAQMARASYEKVTGESADKFADTEMVDICAFNVFPNFGPWGFFNRICYLFRPLGNDPNQSVMDVYMLLPFNKAEGRPPAAKVQRLEVDQDWTQAPNIGLNFARVVNQDVFNLEGLQLGLRSTSREFVNYSKSLEARIRHFHDRLTAWVGC